MLQNNPDRIQKIQKCLDQAKQILKPEHSLLDVGCGRGFVYEYLKHKNYQGIDLSADEVEAARNRFPEGRFDVGDLFSIEGKWDVVLCSRVLIHVAPLDLAMKTLMNAATKYLMLIVRVGPDGVTEYERAGRKFFFRTMSKQTLGVYGEFASYNYTSYSLIVYGR